MKTPISLTIVLPALNEQENLKDAVTTTIAALQGGGIDWEMVLVNDGSTDKTGDIATELASKEPRIKLLHHERPMGIGYCFGEGIAISSKDAITWFPADGENDPEQILKYLPLLEHVDIVVPFVINKGVRSVLRRFVSKFYLWTINLSFGTNFNYTNGTVVYRRHVFERVKRRSNSAVFQAECLVKATRRGFIFAEVPVLLEKRRSGPSKGVSFKSMPRIFWEFIRLFFAVYFGQRQEGL